MNDNKESNADDNKDDLNKDALNKTTETPEGGEKNNKESSIMIKRKKDNLNIEEKEESVSEDLNSMNDNETAKQNNIISSNVDNKQEDDKNNKSSIISNSNLNSDANLTATKVDCDDNNIELNNICDNSTSISKEENKTSIINAVVDK